MCGYTCIAPYVLMGLGVVKHRDSSTFTFIFTHFSTSNTERKMADNIDVKVIICI
jgi:hypothetical protein